MANTCKTVAYAKTKMGRKNPSVGASSNPSPKY